MIVGFSKYGTGPAGSAIGYLTAEEVSVAGAPLGYLTGERTKTGIIREPLPVVLRGDPEKTRALIDSLGFKYKYTSGVLSFSPGERITPAMEEKIMDEFEQVAFAGLEADQRDILWVRHEHAGHAELHVVSPRVELHSGKSLNIAPPGKASRELFDTWRSKINAEYGLADPDDPARARAVRVPRHVAKAQARERSHSKNGTTDPREWITELVRTQIAVGTLKNRDDVVGALKEAGFSIVRQGREYLTVLEPNSGERLRLRGELYRQDFDADRVTLPGTDWNRPAPERTKVLAEKLAGLVEKRAAYNRVRYPQKEIAPVREVLAYDRIGTTPAWGTPPIGGGAQRARARSGAAIARLDHATLLWRGAYERLERASRIAREVHERFVGTTRGFEATLGPAVARVEARELNRRLLQKYGVRMDAKANADREIELEMEMTNRCGDF